MTGACVSQNHEVWPVPDVLLIPVALVRIQAGVIVGMDPIAKKQNAVSKTSPTHELHATTLGNSTVPMGALQQIVATYGTGQP